MGLERGIEFLEHAGREAIGPDLHDGVEVMGGGAVFFALGRGQIDR
jgi:hypothetical protein